MLISPVFNNDEDDTIGRQAHSTAVRGPFTDSRGANLYLDQWFPQAEDMSTHPACSYSDVFELQVILLLD